MTETFTSAGGNRSRRSANQIRAYITSICPANPRPVAPRPLETTGRAINDGVGRDQVFRFTRCRRSKSWRA